MSRRPLRKSGQKWSASVLRKPGSGERSTLILDAVLTLAAGLALGTVLFMAALLWQG